LALSQKCKIKIIKSGYIGTLTSNLNSCRTPHSFDRYGQVKQKTLPLNPNYIFMKKTLKFILVLSLTIVSLVSNAQNLGVKLGLNISNLTFNPESSGEFLMKPGLYLGSTIEFPINNSFAISSNLQLTSKGILYKEVGQNYHTTLSLNFIYLEFPVNFKYSYNLGNTTCFSFVGPSVSIGLFGYLKERNIYSNSRQTSLENMDWWDDNSGVNDFSKFDYGINIGTGVNLDPFQIELTYSLGLANILQRSSDDINKIHYHVIGISLGYNFIHNNTSP